ncbi:MAG: hypothetical protein IT430_09775 [Phycisphaerales bacterium]|nr:hypothetical protein [Phycisphaerales bacterium]
MAGTLNGNPNISFVWHNGVGRFLDAINPAYTADANDINDSGWVVGMSGDFAGNFVPTLWIDGEPMSLGTLGGADGEAEAINNLGHVVGRAANENQPVPGRAFRWADGKMIDLGTLGGGVAVAWGVNNLGQIVGHTFSDDPNIIGQRGFLWENGQMIDIGTLPGGIECQAFDINDLEQIVGHCRDADRNDIAFLWENGEMRSIHNFELGRASWAERINNRSEVVGFVLQMGYAHAFIWNETDGMRLLEDLVPPKHGLKIRIGRDINDHGQIALEAYRGPNQQGIFVGALVTPVHPTMTLADPAPGIAGQPNTLTLTDVTPGATVRFYYSLRGGGELIPGCASRINALQLANPNLVGAATADANGVASFTRPVPLIARGQTILFQAVVQNECTISQLVEHEFE